MKIRDILENFILIAIVLVIIQTFLSEASVYWHWSVKTRNILIFCGFAFDLIFSIEFITRTFIAGKGKENKFRYWFYERGWVDFISSVPLLTLDSGPSVLFLLSGATGAAGSEIGVLNVLKVVKAIRVTRILRLVRIIKIFGKIHNAESKMAQHHTATISTTAVFTIVMTLMAFSLFTDSVGIGKISERKTEYRSYFEVFKGLGEETKTPVDEIVVSMFTGDRKIIKVSNGKKNIVENINKEYLKRNYSHEDYVTAEAGKYILTISIVDINADIALGNIRSFMIIVFVVLSFMIIYTMHFVKNISDLVHVLNKGLRKKDYNLQIKVKEIYRDHEIFRVARFYNDAYLPAKLKRNRKEDENKSSGLSMKDLLNFKGGDGGS
jgi:hypothetical protein